MSKEAVDRVHKFLTERALARGLDKKQIARLHAGDDKREATLNTDDLQVLLAIAEAASEAVDAYAHRFETYGGAYLGPIDAEMRALRSLVMSNAK